MSEWKKVCLGDLVTIRTGKRDANFGSPDGAYPFFTCARQISRCRSYSFDCDAILLAGNCDISNMQRYCGKFEAYQRTYVLTNKDDSISDLDYIWNCLRRDWVKVTLGKMLGAAIQYIKLGMIKEFQIALPPLPTQKRIADILSAYDDLIENNRRRMEILEESARLIYRKMFGGDVPDADRWPVVKIGDILCKVHRAVKIPKEEYCESGTYPCIDQSREFIGGYTNNEAAVNHDLPAIVFGDHTRILKFVRFPFASGADGTQLIRSNDRRISQEFLYYALLEIDLTNYFYARHFKILKNKDLRLPPFDLIAEFTRLVSPMTERTAVLLKENIKLAEARDMLLPKLMNGGGIG